MYNTFECVITVCEKGPLVESVLLCWAHQDAQTNGEMAKCLHFSRESSLLISSKNKEKTFHIKNNYAHHL